MTGQSLGCLPISMYKVIAAYKPEDTTIAKVLLYLRKSGGAIAHTAPLVPTPMYNTNPYTPGCLVREYKASQLQRAMCKLCFAM